MVVKTIKLLIDDHMRHGQDRDGNENEHKRLDVQIEISGRKNEYGDSKNTNDGEG